MFSLPFIEKWLGKDLFFYNPGDTALTEKIKNLSLDIFNMDPLSDTYNFLLMSKIYEILALFSVGCIKKDVSYSICKLFSSMPDADNAQIRKKIYTECFLKN